VNKEYTAFIRQFLTLTGMDLGYYNQAQMLRRLEAFQQKHGLSTYRELLSRIREEEELYQECLHRLTINVSQFFRDTESWQELRKIVSQMPQERLPLRIWSAGCAAGQEAYSLSYMLGSMLSGESWTLMASDLDYKALEAAQKGIYTRKDLKGLSAQQIEGMFTRVDEDLYQVRERLWGKISFFKHDLLQQPYPQALDIVLCRNVLIYFRESAKTKVLFKLAQSLKPGGVLLVGGSEQIMHPDKFGLSNEKVYFYRKKKTG